jgi:hypothetical protein
LHQGTTLYPLRLPGGTKALARAVVAPVSSLERRSDVDMPPVMDCLRRIEHKFHRSVKPKGWAPGNHPDAYPYSEEIDGQPVTAYIPSEWIDDYQTDKWNRSKIEADVCMELEKQLRSP